MKVYDSYDPVTLNKLRPIDEWPEWRKTKTTRAVRIEGPFEVKTSEGSLVCQDGWLAVDARGYLYPIDADEFEQIYESADGGLVLDDPRDDLLHWAMAIISNAGCGATHEGGEMGWQNESPEWQEAARRWMDQYHEQVPRAPEQPIA